MKIGKYIIKFEVDNQKANQEIQETNQELQNTNSDLTEINDANLKLLDTLASKMSSEVLSGKYGKQFQKFLESRHNKED